MASGGLGGKRVCVNCGEIVEGQGNCPKCGFEPKTVKTFERTKTAAPKPPEIEGPIEGQKTETAPALSPEEAIMQASKEASEYRQTPKPASKPDIRVVALAGSLVILLALIGLVFMTFSGGLNLDLLGTTTTTTASSTSTTSTSSTSTTTSSTTSTTTSSTTTSTTTTMMSFPCSVNMDCGNVTEERICHQGDVYLNRRTPICQHPATPYAVCIEKNTLARSPVQACNNGCKDGECLSMWVKPGV
ncbi:MAG: hypothetical protein V1875_09850 [Candidatus Altiarchaeota archaeon]